MPILEGCVASLLATGLAKSASVGHDRVREGLQDTEYRDELDELSRIFEDELQSSLENAADQRNAPLTKDVVEEWELVVGEINDLDLYFENEDEAIDAIVEAIAGSSVIGFRDHPELEETLETVVTDAYVKTVNAFEHRVVENEQLRVLGFEQRDQLLQQINALERRLEPPERYTIYDGTPDGIHSAAERLSTQDIEFVPRPELPDDPTEKTVVVGRKGSGKSRALGELLINLSREVEFEKIVVPRQSLTKQEHFEPLLNRPITGDIVLVWDDIHEIDPTTNNRAFQNGIRDLERAVTDAGHTLYVLSAVRSEYLESTPGHYNFKSGAASGFWGQFDILELEPLEEQSLETLIDRSLSEFEVEASDEARDTFKDAAAETDPSPLYVVSVAATAGSELSSADVESRPLTVEAIWENQYEILRDKDEEAWLVLRAIDLLDVFDLTPYRNVVAGVYRDVYGPGRHAFRSASQTLVSRQWITPIGNGDITEGNVEYIVHDVQISAVDQPVEQYFQNLSEYMFERLESDLTPDLSEYEIVAHFLFAIILANEYERYDIAEEHYEYLLEELEGESSDVYVVRAYARLLRDTDRHEGSIDLLETAITDTTEDPDLIYDYGRALSEADRSERALDQFAKAASLEPDKPKIYADYAKSLANHDREEEAIEQYAAAVALDPDNPAIYADYAQRLADREQNEEALEQFANAVELDPDSPTIYAKYGENLAEHGQVEEAREQYADAVALDPSNPAIYTRYARILADLGREAESLEQYADAVALDPDNPVIYADYGRRLAEHDREEEALEQFADAVALDPDDPEIYGDYARRLAEQGRIEEAVEQYSNAVALNPENPAIYGRYGRRLSQLGRDEEALTQYTNAVALDPDNPDIYADYAQRLVEHGRDEEAVEQFDKAIALDPDSPIIYIRYARLLAERDRVDEAVEQGANAISLDPEDPAVYTVYASILVQLDREEEAITQLEECIDEFPDDPGAYALYGQILGNNGQYERAIDKFDDAVSLSPENPSIYSNYAKLLVKQGYVAEALEQLSNAVSLNPDTPAIYANYANLLEQHDREAEAMEQFSEAVTRDPDDPTIYYHYSEILHRNGREDESLEQLSNAVARDPDSPGIYAQYGGFLAHLGRKEEAIEQYAEAVALDPDIPEIYHHYAVLLSEQDRENDAIQVLSDAIDNHPQTAELYSERGDSYKSLGDYEDALDDYDRAIELNEGLHRVRLKKSEVLVLQGDAEQAETVASAVLESSDEPQLRAYASLLRLLSLASLDEDIDGAKATLDGACSKSFDIYWSPEQVEEWIASAEITEDERELLQNATDALAEHRSEPDYKPWGESTTS